MTARVGVNALFVRPGIVGGSEVYVTSLLRAIAPRMPDDLEVQLYVTRGFAEEHPDVVDAFSTAILERSDLPPARRIAHEHLWLATRTRRNGMAVTHHLGGTMPARRPTPGMVTVHDLQPLIHPERFRRAKSVYLQRALPRAARSAVRVVAVSHFTAAQVIQHLGVPASRVDVVRTGVESITVADTDVIDRLGVGGRYFVYPAITYSHKNHRTLVEAFERLDRDDVELVLVGGSADAESALAEQIARCPRRAQIHRPGRVADDDVTTLYRHAAALTFPSSHEGLGIPTVEAMAHGCPVISSDAGGLPEAVGDAGLLIEPTDVAGWTSAMARLLDEPGLADDLRRAGEKQRAGFTWDASAQAQIESWRRAVEELRR